MRTVTVTVRCRNCDCHSRVCDIFWDWGVDRLKHDMIILYAIWSLIKMKCHHKNTSCIIPCWWCHLYFGDHSFNNNRQMGHTPHFLHHSNILLWKGCYTYKDANPHLLIANQTCYHYTKVPWWQRRMEDVCLACSLSVSYIPPASHATQETWREPTSPCLKHCCYQMGRGWDLVASQSFMPVVLYHTGGSIYTMVTIVLITTSQMGCTPRSLHHSNILLKILLLAIDSDN